MTKAHWPILLFNSLYIAAFTLYYVARHNFEFLLYIGVLVFFFVLIFWTLPKSKFGPPILWGLSIWGLLHMAGGGIPVGQGVLYDLILLPLVSRGEIMILRYDQAVHCFGFGVTTLVGFHLLSPYLNEKTNWKVIYLILAGFGMGMGALNEIVEFLATVLIPNTGVGGYVNTALDLVFNFLGSLIAVLLIHLKFRRPLMERSFGAH
jgi:hypothetical protein